MPVVSKLVMQAKAKAHQEHEHFPRHLDRTLELINHLVLHLLCRQLRGVGHVVLVEAKLQQGSTIIKKNRHMRLSLFCDQSKTPREGVQIF